jgi:hypothetical protein
MVSRWGTGLGAADPAGGARLLGAGQVGLDRADDRGEDSERESSWPQRTDGIHAQRVASAGPGFGAHVPELPVDLVVDRLGPIRRRQSGRFRGIRGCPPRRSRASYLACGTAGNKPPTDLLGGTELTGQSKSAFP